MMLPWYLWRTGRTTVTWDIEPDSHPEVASSASSIVAHVGERVRPGSIVLLHPWSRARRTSRSAVPDLIDEVEKQGFRFVTLSELLQVKRSTGLGEIQYQSAVDRSAGREDEAGRTMKVEGESVSGLSTDHTRQRRKLHR